ncbi:MAG: aspartate ammonia-lyase, partial [Phycisphaerales bacterium JB038]
MSDWRQENDGLGPQRVPAQALWGAQTSRALENFPLSDRPVARPLVHAYGAVKVACARTNHELGRWDEATFQAIERACTELLDGALDEHIVVDALQGGAGTSTNMNVNEVLANRALQLLGRPLGDYDTIHPLDDLNRHQSTNDTYPTALRVAAIGRIRALEPALLALVDACQGRERAFEHIVKVGRTQLQDAVLTTLGRSFGAYAEAFGRDRWRLTRCEERLRVVNLGGTAIGTGLGAPRRFIFRAVEHLREITGMGLARAENLVEATQNVDAFVEVSGILRTLASNLLKVSNDLRLLASGPDAGLGEIRLPPRQAGSSIMPGKVNPVIPEAVGQCALAVLGHDQVLAQASSLGSLELNQYMPLIADSLLTSIDLLEGASRALSERCLGEIEANAERCRSQVAGATAAATALVSVIGYEKAAALAREAEIGGQSVRQLAVE